MDTVAVEGGKPALARWLLKTNLPDLIVSGQICSRGERMRILQELSALPGDLSELEALPAAVLKLREESEPISRDAFFFALYEAFHSANRPRNERWIVAATALLGGDRCALRAGAQVKQWAEALNRVCANIGIEILKLIGSDTAIMQLDSIARKVRRNSVKVRAQTAVQKIAKDRNLSLDELADRIVPTCDLNQEGTRCFDFGARRFWFVAGTGLQAKVRDESGDIRPDLPGRRQSDDPAKATEAIASWKLLKKQVRDVWKLQAERLEQAMVIERRWSFDAFRSYFLLHPVMRHLARLIIWGEFTQEGNTRTFRMGEDFTFFDSEDAPVQIGNLGEIGVVHPLYLGAQEISAWAQICLDYELLPPFDQMNRSVHLLTSEEMNEFDLRRYSGEKVHPLSLLSKLTKFGWTRGDLFDGGTIAQHVKYFKLPDVTAVLRYHDGIPISDPRWAEEQTLDDCAFVSGLQAPTSWSEMKEKLKLSQVPKLIISETLRDLALVTLSSE